MLLQLTLSALLATIAASQGIEPASRSVRPPIHHDVDAMRMKNMSFLESGFSLGLWTAFAGPLIAGAPEIPKNSPPLKTLSSPTPDVPEDVVPPDVPTTFLPDLYAFCTDSFEPGTWMLQYLPTDSVISNGNVLLCGIATVAMAVYMLSYQYSLIKLARQDDLFKNEKNAVRSKREDLQNREDEAFEKPGKKRYPNGSSSKDDPTFNPPPLKRLPTTDLDKITKPLETGLPESVKSDDRSSDGSLTTKVNGYSPERNEDPAEGKSTTSIPKRGIRLFRPRSSERKKITRKRKQKNN